jgi:hypothetical protein
MARRKRVDPSSATVLELAYARTGSMLKAARVVAFITGWAVTTRELGREPTVDEYAEWWKENRATVYRHLALFREVFDRCETPAPVVAAMEAQRATAGSKIDFGQLVAA